MLLKIYRRITSCKMSKKIYILKKDGKIFGSIDVVGKTKKEKEGIMMSLSRVYGDTNYDFSFGNRLLANQARDLRYGKVL